MKIAELAQLWVSVPPEKYGGAALIVSELTEELVKRGHEVTLFAPGDSRTKAKLVAVAHQSSIDMGIDWSDLNLELINISECFKHANDFDVIHGHISASNPSIYFSQLFNTPSVFTLHNTFLSRKNEAQKIIIDNIKKVNFVSISKNFQKENPNLNYIGNVYNGIDLKKYHFNDKPKNYLAWLGRFDNSKGAKEAIDVAEKLGMELILAGRVSGESENDYFKNFIKPRLNNRIKYIGEVDLKAKNNLLSNAYVTLIPTNWMEPFGLVTVEALACGSPVVAFDMGANKEIVADNKTGYIVPKADVQKMVEAVKKIDRISRYDCRKHVEENFSVQKMADGYENIFKKVRNYVG